MCSDKAGNGEHVARVNGITTNRLSGSVISHKIMASFHSIDVWTDLFFLRIYTFGQCCPETESRSDVAMNRMFRQ